MSPLGIIAGGGELPRAIAQSASAQGRKVHVLAIKGCADDAWPSDYPHAWIGIGEWGHAVKYLKEAGITDMLLVGRVDRPNWSEIKVDGKGLMNLPAVIAAARIGDDALLK
jgi:DUF1009 family protein